MVESQALDRVHRIGQKHQVTTYRYIAKDTFEEVGLIQKKLSCLALYEKNNLSLQSIRLLQSKKLELAELTLHGAKDSNGKKPLKVNTNDPIPGSTKPHR